MPPPSGDTNRGFVLLEGWHAPPPQVTQSRGFVLHEGERLETKPWHCVAGVGACTLPCVVKGAFASNPSRDKI